MDELSYLSRLISQLRALEAGEPFDVGVDASSVRARIARQAITDGMRQAREAELERGRTELLASLDAIVSRAPAVLPPPRTPRSTALFDPDEPMPAPFWSPTPILAFRVWDVRAHLHGARRVWSTPEYVAGCVRGRNETLGRDVPHTDGSCGRPPCGIYAAKHAADLVESFGTHFATMAYGVVELTGKVVEHDSGYRAQRAKAVAVAVVRSEYARCFEGDDLVGRLFADPGQTLDRGRFAPLRLDAHGNWLRQFQHGEWVTQYLERTRIALATE